MPNNAESGSRKEFGKLIELAYLVVILCACIWAKEFLLPIVLAILISFLLAPVVSRLERLGLHPVLAVLVSGYRPSFPWFFRSPSQRTGSDSGALRLSGTVNQQCG